MRSSSWITHPDRTPLPPRTSLRPQGEFAGVASAAASSFPHTHNAPTARPGRPEADRAGASSSLPPAPVSGTDSCCRTVEPRGVEPRTSAVQRRRSPS
jgi:hypothetical protein